MVTEEGLMLSVVDTEKLSLGERVPKVFFSEAASDDPDFLFLLGRVIN